MEDGSREPNLNWLIVVVLVLLFIGGLFGYVVGSSGFPENSDSTLIYDTITTLCQLLLVLIAFFALGSWRKELNFVKKKEKDELLIANKHKFLVLAECLHEIVHNINEVDQGLPPRASAPPEFELSTDCRPAVKRAVLEIENCIKALYSIAALSSYISSDNKVIKEQSESFSRVFALLKVASTEDSDCDNLVSFGLEENNDVCNFRNFLVEYCEINKDDLDERVFG